MNIDSYSQILGLTCVENHVLAFLTDNGFDIRNCYANSGISFTELCVDYINGAETLHTNRVCRVQEALKKDGIIALKRHKNAELEELLEAVRTAGIKEVVLAGIQHEYAVNTLGARGWRNDHFAALKEKDGLYRLLNDAPATERMIDYDEMKTAYRNEYMFLAFLRHYTDKERHERYKNRKYQPAFHLKQAAVPDFTADPAETGFRDALFVYKTLQKRLSAYYSMIIDNGVFAGLLKELEQLFTRVEYFRIRRSLTPEQLNSFYHDVTDWETNMRCKQQIALKSI
jgi:hypothetical protein